MEEKSTETLFFGFQCQANWPEDLPNGRFIAEANRHITIAFLGKTDIDLIMQQLEKLPLPKFFIPPIGLFDKCLFLPPRNPRCVSWHTEFITKEKELINYQKELAEFLYKRDFLDKKQIDRPFLPHMTICRKPFILKEWKKSFYKMPFCLGPLHLYKSLGHSDYEPIWSHIITYAFEEIEHTADIGFLIRGESLDEMQKSAEMALGSIHPPILKYTEKRKEPKDLDHIIIDLNRLITRADKNEGCAFKAVSFHGDIKEKNQILEWEMIIDV